MPSSVSASKQLENQVLLVELIVLIRSCEQEAKYIQITRRKIGLNTIVHRIVCKY
jgi:hypothetical protein